MDTTGIRKELVEYITSGIVPLYAGFDPAHREDHAEAVMENSLKLYRAAPEAVKAGIDPEILFTAAACHDIGRINGKEKHHVDSGKMIRADMTFRKWFDEAGIELIAQAAEDHRASSGAEPRSIYGKIVAEADRLIDKDTVERQCESRGNGCILPAYSPSLFRFLVKYIMMQSTRKSASVPMSRLPDSIVSRR